MGVRYVRLYSGVGGQATFEDGELELNPREFAPPAPPLDVSSGIDASTFMVLRMPAGWTDAAHPAPARQFMVVLSGCVEVTTANDARRLSTGDMILLEDTEPPGHGTTVIEELTMAVTQLSP